ncbi:MAG: M20/M25/M40 family metallo-hydrolase, partial [Planctomycetes bacterium]|nr:M20/M25/M40 family metallo-hydrolase [Planctomycetota bacterium]
MRDGDFDYIPGRRPGNGFVVPFVTRPPEARIRSPEDRTLRLPFSRRQKEFASRFGLPLLAAALAALLAAGAPPSLAGDPEPRGGPESITGKELLEHVKVLSSAAYRGRSSGTPDCEAAARYLASQFKKSEVPGGLKDDSRYFQAFPIVLRAELGTSCALVLQGPRGIRACALEREFVPLSCSGNGAKKGKVVFAGYGITAPEFAWDDFAGIDAKGRIVLCLRHEPRASDAASPFRGKESTEHAYLLTKVLNAQAHGAAAVLIANDPLSVPLGDDVLKPFGGPSDARVKIPAAFVLQIVADEILAGSGETLGGLQARIDGAMKPSSLEIPGRTAGLSADVRRRSVPTQNVVAFVEGSDPERKGEFVVVGAHYDHVGTGEYGSRLGAAGRGKIHPGADDNASGTAAVLEIAEAAAGLAAKPRRSLLFVAFSGEERGLLGSSAYVAGPARPLDRTVAMLNLDMISRGPARSASVGFTGTWAKWDGILREAGAALGLRLETTKGGTGASDHAPFLQARIPCLMFFSGLHEDYHTPGDTWDKADPETMQGIARLAYLAAVAAADSPERPEFRQPEAAEPPLPFLGVVPGQEVKDAGLEIREVQKESPAEKGGMKAGDVLAEMDGRPVRTPQDLKDVLAMKKPGDEVKATVV